MKRIEYFKLLEQVFNFKTISDEKGNEYVLLASNPLDSIQRIKDKTAFEAVENHVHLLDHLKKQEFEALIPIAETLCKTLAHRLSKQYPNKKFLVYSSLTLKDSFILRFHQKWENEEPYYNPADFNAEAEKIFVCEI